MQRKYCKSEQYTVHTVQVHNIGTDEFEGLFFFKVPLPCMIFLGGGFVFFFGAQLALSEEKPVVVNAKTNAILLCTNRKMH